MSNYVFIDLFGTLGGTGIDDIRNFKFFDFSIPALQLLNTLNLQIVIITNQSRISKGEYSLYEFEVHKNRLLDELEKHRIILNKFLFCPHTDKDQCDCKKPKTGMIINNIHNADYEKSYVIGDMGKTDMLLAKNIGSKGILVKTGVGNGSMNEFRYCWKEYEPYKICENIEEASKFISIDMRL